MLLKRVFGLRKDERKEEGTGGWSKLEDVELDLSTAISMLRSRKVINATHERLEMHAELCVGNQE
jgi:hypothetical protein